MHQIASAEKLNEYFTFRISQIAMNLYINANFAEKNKVCIFHYLANG